MKTHDEILKGLEQCRYIDVPCDSCPYDKEEVDNCQEFLLKDAAAFIRQLLDVNRALRTELATNHIGDGNKKAETKPWGQYWQNICDMNERQEAKGRKKYGVPLEENTDLNFEQRIEYLQEELVDALKYCEHLKAGVRATFGNIGGANEH